MPTKANESLLKFPCRFPLRVIGHNVREFEPVVTAIVQKHVPDLDPQALSRRPSGANRYLALTVTFEAQSREQLDAIYLELNAHELVLYTL